MSYSCRTATKITAGDSGAVVVANIQTKCSQMAVDIIILAGQGPFLIMVSLETDELTEIECVALVAPYQTWRPTRQDCFGCCSSLPSNPTPYTPQKRMTDSKPSLSSVGPRQGLGIRGMVMGPQTSHQSEGNILGVFQCHPDAVRIWNPPYSTLVTYNLYMSLAINP